MEIILTKDYTKPNGRIIKKGTRAIFTNEAALQLIDKKEARPINFIDKAIDKIIDIKETATHKPEAETTEQKTKPDPKKKVITN